jgi:hypothetical protein
MNIVADLHRLHRYAVYGVTLVTSLPLSLPRAGDSDVIVKLDLVSPDQSYAVREGIITAPTHEIDQAVREDGALYLRWFNWFEMLVSADGRHVLCHKLSDLPLTSFEAYLTNFAVSTALLQQGEEPLHATVVDIGGRTVGFLGSSGAGKSTLAAILINRGGTLLTDDMLRVTFEDNVAFAQPGPYRLKLFLEPAERYFRTSQRVGYWNPSGEKLIFEPDTSGDRRSPRPLSAFYYLDEPSPSLTLDAPVVEQLSGVEQFKVILSSSMNTRLRSPDRLKRQFLFAERFARMCPVFRLTYPRNFDLIDQVADQIYETAPC